MSASAQKPTRGTIFVASRAAQSILRSGRLLSSDAWLDGWGPFTDGDFVYLVVRGNDGGQRVLCRAHARCDVHRLRALRSASFSTATAPAFELAMVISDPTPAQDSRQLGDSGD